MKYSVATLEPAMLHGLKSNDIIESIEEDRQVSINPIIHGQGNAGDLA